MDLYIANTCKIHSIIYILLIFENMQEWCKACVLLDGLNRGLPKLGIGRTKTINGGGGSGGVKPGTKSRLSNVGMKESRTRSRQYSGSVDF